MKKKYALALAVFAAFFSLSASSFKVTEAPEEFENLKVLPKNITEEKLDSIMRHFSISLGVRCNFCHAESADTSQKRHLDFASDKIDEKNTARRMYEMTAYLNANYFNWNHSTRPDTIHEVVCYTCHRGTKEPDAKVFLAVIDSTIQARRNKK